MADSIRQVHTSGAQYDPLPLETDPTQRPYYNNSPHPPSPGVYPMDELPSGASRPRFQGPAVNDGSRLSLASSAAHSRASDYDSVYGLQPAARSSTGLQAYHDNPSQVFADSQRYADAPVPMSPRVGNSGFMDEKRATYASPREKTRKKWIYILGGLGLLLLIAAVVIPVYLFVIKGDDSDDSSSSNKPNGDNNNSSGGDTNTDGGSKTRVVTGGDGSEITMEDGTKFTYRNPFGGIWYYDENDPFNNGARAQSWSPALNESFRYGIDIIRGVNFGGWLNTEPFISPALYEQYENAATPAVDEWTLSTNMRADTARGGIQQLEEHYKTFITEKDFADVAGAGLNYIRIPIGFWIIETRGDEPFLEKTSWTYFLKAIQWARKYGLRINLDLHALPGSQNGWNHSGRLGQVNFLNGPMGMANAQRSLDYIRILAEFISQPQYRDVVTMFGIMNEPQGSIIGRDNLDKFYMESYNIIRAAGGVGEGNGPFVSFHDGFMGQNNWGGFMPGADRITLDSHPYMCFAEQSADPVSAFATRPCGAWATGMNESMALFGLSNAGEWSLAVNDCGLFLNGVGLGTRFEGTYTPGSYPRMGDCEPYLDWQSWSTSLKADYRRLALSSMDALQNYFFWTWKIGNSTSTGTVRTPHWSYSLGLQEGWMPTDPREAVNACGGGSPFVGPLAPYQTGGAGAGSIPASVSSALSWPPATINNGGAVALLPVYTQTAPIPTLPVPTFTTTSGRSTGTADAGSGWANSADTAGIYTEIAGCTYLDPWVGPDAEPPAPCAAAAVKRRTAPEPFITPPPL